MDLRRTISLLLSIGLVGASPIRVSASDAKEVLIRGSEVRGKVLLIKADLNGKPTELECFLSDANCKVPRPGRYLVTGSRDNIYQDCTNVDLFEVSSDGKRGSEVGTYCDLSGPGGMATETAPEIKPGF